MLDHVDKVCAILMMVPVLAYLILLRGQYLNLQKKTYRLTVLCVRAALFLPLYAILMYLYVLAPDLYVIMMVAITVVEGYSFYCFLTLITTNLGGPAATVDLMYQSQRPLVCNCCCPSDSAVFYRKTTWAIFHLFITRSVLSVISLVCFISNTKAGKLSFVFLNCISAAILFYGVMCLVNLCKSSIRILCVDFYFCSFPIFKIINDC